MSDVTITLDTGNAAMSTATDVAEALRDIADRIEAGADEGKVRDINGNTVGSFSVTLPDPEDLED